MSFQEKLALVLLASISLFLFATQNVMNPVIQEIMKEYSVTEKDVGWIGSAFILVGACCGIVIGYWTDRSSRIHLFSAVVLVGTIPCFLNGFRLFTPSYSALLWLRIISGIGVAGIFPITFSLIGDYFDTRHRAKIIALITTAWGLGQLLGQVAGGFLSNHFGWRCPFWLVAVPNFILIPLFLMVAKEPKRGCKESVSPKMQNTTQVHHSIQYQDIRFLITNKTNWLALVQGIPGSIPWGLLPFFLVPYYETYGFSKEFATGLTLVLGIALNIGGIWGGWIGDRLYRQSPPFLAIFGGMAIAISLVPLYFMFWHAQGTISFSKEILLLTLAGIAGIIMGLPSGNIKAVLLNVNAPEHRGFIFGIHNITDSLGRGLGPWIGGIWIQQYGYWQSMLWAMLLWIPCAILYAMVAATIRHDLQRLHQYLQSPKNIN